MGVSGLAFLDPVTDHFTYFIFAIVFRFFQGVGDVTIQTAIKQPYSKYLIVYSILTNMYSESREKVLGWGETAAGMGLFVGPILGGELNTKFGYFWCYITLAAFLLLDLIFTIFVMPQSLN